MKLGLEAASYVLALTALAAACGCGGDGKGGGKPEGGDPDAAAADGGVDAAVAGDADAGEDAGPPGDAGDGAGDAGDGTADVADTGTVGPSPRVSPRFRVRPSVEQIHVWKAPAGLSLEVVDAEGARLAQGVTDELGSLVFRLVPPGAGYLVRPVDDPDDYTGPLAVLAVADSFPGEEFYASQDLVPGYQYLTMRDGTQLSVFVSLPGPPEDGPYPTVVNYSGYSPSRPGRSLGGMAEAFCGVYPILCNAPDDPSLLIAGLLGFAGVGVNLRGTGCSGGAYDYFEPLQLLDGYDVIEIVARQPWVKHHQVGMVGLSFPGITQLFVASIRPPGLAAITPQSVIGNTSTTMVPGGIINVGFAMEWIEHVLDRAEPYGQGWERERVDAGDTICEENQLLHSQKVDVIQKVWENPFYTDEVAKPLDPEAFVTSIDVPVFLTGQLQDEQTGPHFPILLDRFLSSPLRRFILSNGVHIDGFAPQIIAPWYEFLALTVAREVPAIAPEMAAMVPLFMEQVFGARLALPPLRFDGFASFEEAWAAYQAEPDLRVIFENGAAPGVSPGAPQGTFVELFTGWPIPGTETSRWFFHPDGTLRAAPPPVDGGASSWQPDLAEAERVTLASGSVDVPQPDWRWVQPLAGRALAFTSEPLAADLVLIGHGSVDLWLRSDAADADLEVTLTEVRPDGQESLVQLGWLRASHRGLLPGSTELRPRADHYREHCNALVADEWNLVRVELMPVSHLFRAGSQLRLLVDAPGGSMARWRFDPPEHALLPTHVVAHSAAYPSSLALPRVPTLVIPTELPPCTSLRGQPCRPYVPFVNTPWPG